MTWNKWHQKWTSQIRYKGKQHHIGVFLDPVDAAKAYDAAAAEHHGAKAVLNFPADSAGRQALQAHGRVAVNGGSNGNNNSSSNNTHSNNGLLAFPQMSPQPLV